MNTNRGWLNAGMAIAVLLLIVGGSSLLNGEFGGLFIGGFGLYLLARQLENRNRQAGQVAPWDERGAFDDVAESVPQRDVFGDTPARRAAPRTTIEEVRAPGNRPQYQMHALEAARRVGLDPQSAPVLPMDIGLMGYEGHNAPRIFRTRDVPESIDAIQPFVQLRVPAAARGLLRFEVVNAAGEVQFVHEDYYDLKAGVNLISPPMRMPVKDAMAFADGWLVRVVGDGIPLAEHAFGWVHVAPLATAEALADDGEISDDLRELVRANSSEKVSLDDLLAFQDEDEQAARRR